MLFGSYLITVTPDNLFKQGVGAFALVFSSVHIVKMIKSHYNSSKSPKNMVVEKIIGLPGVTVFFGFLGGLASAVVNAGGLVLSVYMLQKRANPRVFVGTLVLFFALTNLFKIISFSAIGITDIHILILVAAFSPVIILGGVLGSFLNKKLSQEMFRLIVLIILLLLGVRLLFAG